MPPVPADPPSEASMDQAVGALTGADPGVSALDLLNSYTVVFVAAFLVTLLVTPLVRLVALRAELIDRPDEVRKRHEYPVATLGGVAVFLGLVAALAVSYVFMDGVAARYRHVPFAVILGMTAVMFTGLADDIWGWHPRLKIAGQLVAAAALAYYDIGVRVAAGVLRPLAAWAEPVLGSADLMLHVPLPGGSEFTIDVIYWAGTAVIALFVVGGCNAANLIDGLDGLLSGVVGIAALGLLCISVLMVVRSPAAAAAADEPLAGARIVLCLALLGAVLGFLPHNFNPASIFLGDCGSHLLGYLCVVIILMFGEFGQTHLVFAGLIVFSVPIMDTTLAIIRRVLAGRSMSAADDQHMHHQLRRALGGVKRAVLALYGLSVVFAVMGVTLAGLVMLTEMRIRIVYAIALVLFGFVAMVAVKAARRERISAAAQPAASRTARPATPADAAGKTRAKPAEPAAPATPVK